jgi:hypothetical protein
MGFGRVVGSRQVNVLGGSSREVETVLGRNWNFVLALCGIGRSLPNLSSIFRHHFDCLVYR